MTKSKYVYYSVPNERSRQKYILDFSNTGWSAHDPGLHEMYRNIFPGSIIHCGLWYPEDKSDFTNIKYHLGER